MNGSEQVFLDHPLGNQDRVFEVVAAPRHERDQHVAPERQLAHVGRRPVGEHVAGLDPFALNDNRPLIDAGILIAALVFDQIVNVHARVAQIFGLLVGAHHDSLRIDALDHSVALADHGNARVAAHGAFESGSHQGSVGLEQRHRLALHVGSHQRSIRIVIFEERNKRRSD